MHVQDEVYENAEMCDPSTTHRRAITHFCVAQWQGVKIGLCEYVFMGLNVSSVFEHSCN
jgi:hypothetical protein